MQPILYQVDAFTNQPFKGNPAAVCVLRRQESEKWMQSLSAEMNLSETAYLSPEKNGWRLRWFTPTTEVDLCGHATLASASVLFELHPKLKVDGIEFYTRSGSLFARWDDGRVVLDFPVMHYCRMTYEEQVARVLGFEPIDAVFSGNYFLFQADDANQVRTARPDIAALTQLPMPEVIITAQSDQPQYDFISRFFAPQLGVDEDPVTGSAHCLLAPFWAEKLGQREFDAYQASERGGELHLQLMDERVLISGEAVMIMKAELYV